MPTGIPSLSALPAKLGEARIYFQIPSYEEYSTAFSDAARDFVSFFQSIFRFIHLSTKPLLILLALLGRYIILGLAVIAEHTLKHGVVAIREASFQARTGALWFLRWQRSLSNFALGVEAAALSGLVGLYLLRRHIRRKKYLERAARWYRRKKNEALMKYNILVQTVSETSIFLALLLPHFLYFFCVALIKYLAPWLLRYFSMHTPAAKAISLWIPLWETVSFLHRDIDDAEDKGKQPYPSKAADAKSPPMRKAKRKSGKSPPARIHPTKTDSDTKLEEEGMNILRYWVVYSLIFASYRVITMLPVVSKIFTAAGAAGAPKRSRWAPQPGRISRAISSVRPTEETLQELRMVFFVWLCHLPTSLTGVGSDSTKGQTKKKMREQSNRPLDILYSRFGTVAMYIADFSLAVSRGVDAQHNGPAPLNEQSSASGTIGKGLAKVLGIIRSFLDVAVFMKVISTPTRDWISTAIADGAALIPAAITLFMPGYFTEFGVIFVSNVLPAANSALTHDTKCVSLVGRYLRYWVIHAMLSGLISSFRPVLMWIPLSSHATWLLWAYVQQQSATSRLYSILEWEMVCFGLLRAQGDLKTELPDIFSPEKAVTTRLLKKASNILPSGVAHNKEELESNANDDIRGGHEKED